LEVQEMDDQEAWDGLMETLGRAGGSKSKQFGEMIFNQLASSCHINKEPGDTLLSVIGDII
jgi:hypothetical protein